MHACRGPPCVTRGTGTLPERRKAASREGKLYRGQDAPGPGCWGTGLGPVPCYCYFVTGVGRFEKNKPQGDSFPPGYRVPLKTSCPTFILSKVQDREGWTPPHVSALLSRDSGCRRVVSSPAGWSVDGAVPTQAGAAFPLDRKQRARRVHLFSRHSRGVGHLRTPPSHTFLGPAEHCDRPSAPL